MISEEFLDELGIYSTPGSISRDKLTECRKHAFLVTHTESIERHRESLRNRSKVPQDTNQVEEQKRHRADVALVARMEAAQARKVQKEIQKGIEKERFAALSSEEQKKEREDARAAVAERRKSKELEQRQKFEAARARLARREDKSSEILSFQIVDENDNPGSMTNNC